MSFKIISACSLLAFAAMSRATVWPSGSLDATAINTLMNGISVVSGDTILLPSGRHTNSQAVIIPSGKNLMFQGAGTNSIGGTWLCGDAGLPTLLTMQTTASCVYGISFVSGFGTTSANCILVGGIGWRIGNCLLTTSTPVAVLGVYPRGNPSGLTTFPVPSGVIDHCIFDNARVNTQGDVGTAFGWLNTIWSQANPIGTSNMVYLENVEMALKDADGSQNPLNITDAEYGGRYCVRFSSLHWQVFNHPDLSSDGTGERGTRWTELYGNSFVISNIVNVQNPVWIRAGSGNVFSNTISGTWSTLVRLDDEAGMFDFTGSNPNGADGNYPYGPYGSGTHTGANAAPVLTSATANWSVNELVTAKTIIPNISFNTNLTLWNITDGSLGRITANSATTATATLTGGVRNNWNTGDAYLVTGGYPTRDQPGTVRDVSTWPGSGPRPAQTLRPIYVWGNTVNGSSNNGVSNRGLNYFIQEGRDWTNAVASDLVIFPYPHPLIAFWNSFLAPVTNSAPVPVAITGRVEFSGTITIYPK